MGASRVKVTKQKSAAQQCGDGRPRPSKSRPGRSQPHRTSRSQSILALLAGGDRRSIGRANQVAAIVSKDSALFPKLIAGLWSEDALVRMRAADAAEKISRKNPALLKPYKAELLGLMSEADQQEVRWHLAAMVPRLPLNAKERQRAAAVFQHYLEDRSSIVKTFALQGLADLAKNDSTMRPLVIELLREAERGGTSAMKARSRKLLPQLERA
jgi:hypothetical protein